MLKKSKITPDLPEVPEGWTLQVRPQMRNGKEEWEYRLTPPTRVIYLVAQPVYCGTYFQSRDNAIRSAIELAEAIEDRFVNASVNWETV
jgi:hypothetical protein